VAYSELDGRNEPYICNHYHTVADMKVIRELINEAVEAEIKLKTNEFEEALKKMFDELILYGMNGKVENVPKGLIASTSTVLDNREIANKLGIEVKELVQSINEIRMRKANLKEKTNSSIIKEHGCVNKSVESNLYKCDYCKGNDSHNCLSRILLYDKTNR